MKTPASERDHCARTKTMAACRGDPTLRAIALTMRFPAAKIAQPFRIHRDIPLNRIRLVFALCLAIGFCVPAAQAARAGAGSPPIAVLTVVTNKFERTAHHVGHKVDLAAHRVGMKVSHVAHRTGAEASRLAHRAGARVSSAAHTVGRKVEHEAHVVRVKAERKGAAMRSRLHRALHHSPRSASIRKAGRRPVRAARAS